MIEKHYILEESDPAIFYGANNAHLKMLRALCPKLRIMARDNVVRTVGSEEDVAAFEEILEQLDRHCAKFLHDTDKRIADAQYHEAVIAHAVLVESRKRRDDDCHHEKHEVEKREGVVDKYSEYAFGF